MKNRGLIERLIYSVFCPLPAGHASNESEEKCGVNRDKKN